MQLYVIFLLFSLFSLNGCQKTPSETKAPAHVLICPKPTAPESFTTTFCLFDKPKQHTITVWIHGTRVFFSKFLCPNFFYTRQGLHNATTFEQQYHVREIAELLHRTDSLNFPLENIYFYGWSGKLSFKARYKAAKKLYASLIQIINDYTTKHGVQPKIRIITHSHGGNVALNLACFNQDLKLRIDELILLACPVQQRTCHLSSHDTFEKIYSLFSRFDSFQILDPQKLYYYFNRDLAHDSTNSKPKNFFSQRLFPEHKKITHVRLKFNNRGIMHIEFIMNKFVGVLPLIMKEIQCSQNYTYKEVGALSIEFI